MVFSLFTSGLMFIGLQFITSFWGLCIAMFLIMAVADMFRPAMFVSLGAYAKPENRTRALTLVRLAVNLGFAAGPALGGLLTMNVGYNGLFYADGFSCILAISIFALLVKEKKKSAFTENDHLGEILTTSVFKDRTFWIFLFVSFSTAMIFFQLFTTLPLYHNEQFGLSELETGLLMTLNGLLIFLLEMPIVTIATRKKIPLLKIMFWGAVAMALAFYVLLFDQWKFTLIISILFLTLGEMLLFPFSNSFALSRAPKGHEGRYMALFTMSFSLAHIASSKTGMELIANFNYQTNWAVMGSIGISAAVVSWYLIGKVKQENLLEEQASNNIQSE